MTSKNLNKKTLYLFTRTPLHVGAGNSVGAIDQLVQREKHTGFPIVPGSAIKGVLADAYNETTEDGKVVIDEDRRATMRTKEGAKLFGLGAGKKKGDNGQSGAISFGEAQLLAFPVRSAKGCFAWLTSPLALKRWQRTTGKDLGEIHDTIGDNKACFCEKTLGEKLDGQSRYSALFEDYVFHHESDFSAAKVLEESIAVDGLWSDLAAAHLVLVSDHTLSHFARTACEVAQHVVIDDETGTAKEGLLFNQENVPAETLFFSTLTEFREGALEKLEVPNPLQVGGDATTGLGFCSTNIV
jgi:CRISPR-associated protein Cmr4